MHSHVVENQAFGLQYMTDIIYQKEQENLRRPGTLLGSDCTF